MKTPSQSKKPDDFGRKGGRIKRVENNSNKVQKKIFFSPPFLSIFQQT